MRVALREAYHRIRAVFASVVCFAGLLAAPAAGAEIDDHAAAFSAATFGPASITLAGQAAVALTSEDGFVPMPQAQNLLDPATAQSPDTVGVILPRNGSGKWIIVVAFHKLGFVRSEVIAKLTKEEIFDQMRAAARRGNERRKSLGQARLDLSGFVEAPFYDQPHDRMSLAAGVLSYGAGDGVTEAVTVETHVFGREGVMTLTLATNAAGYSNLRHHMEQLAATAAFLPGKRLADAAADDAHFEYPLEVLFGGRTPAEIARERTAADNRRRQYELIEEDRQRAEWDWQLKMIAAGASLLISSMAVFAFNRATAA